MQYYLATFMATVHQTESSTGILVTSRRVLGAHLSLHCCHWQHDCHRDGPSLHCPAHLQTYFELLQSLRPCGLTVPKWHASPQVYVKAQQAKQAQQAEQAEQAHLDEAGGGHGCKQIREQWGNLFWLCPAIDQLI